MLDTRSPLPVAVAVSLIGAALVYVLSKPLEVADLAIFMAMGRWMVEHRQLFETEVFAFTEIGQTFVNGTWLAQLVFYGLFQAGGYPLLQLASAACVGIALVTVGRHGAETGGRASVGALAVALAFTLALQNLGLRPQTFSIPLFCLAYFVADRRAERRWAPWAIAGIFAAWPNLHGAFPAALGILGALAGGEALRAFAHGGVRAAWASPQVRRRALLVAVAIGATLLNPYGPGIYLYVATNSEMPRTRMLDEWLPASPTSFMGIRLILSMALVVWALGRRIRRDEAGWRALPIEDGIILLAFAWLAVGSQRMILWWGLAASPILCRHLGATLGPAPSPSPLHRRMLQVSLALWAALVVLANPWLARESTSTVAAEGYPGLHPDAPVAAIALLDARPRGGRVFNKMMWGSYLVWRLWPRYTPFVDPRIWIFDDAVWADYLRISRAEAGWEEALASYGVDVLLLEEETQGALIDAASASPRWALLHRDAAAAILTHRDGDPTSAGSASEERP